MARTTNTLLKTLGTQGIIAPKLVLACYKMRLEAPPRDRDGYISPSSILGCHTAAIRQLRGEPKVHVGSSWMLLPNVGTYIHGELQDMAVVAGILKPANRELTVQLPDLKMLGSVDGVLNLDRDVHWEIKSTTERDLDSVGSTNQPIGKHKAQAVAYQMCLGLGETLFSYVGRQYCAEPTEVFFRYDPAIAQAIVTWCQEVIKAAEGPDYSRNVWGKSQCNWCRYFPLCTKTFERR